ncbi:PREDICTED: neuropeptides capa receptor-like [Wasmannia auropunctata]|uniref:neuropeptides capa receptor-like n=1 Tax=Wasmannia auropunctata TaxID=64793 RepID=UPI0005EF4BFF|nr:PREDICTED: neuropeptides capa receptor-like [Wasmannia auropunctata]
MIGIAMAPTVVSILLNGTLYLKGGYNDDILATSTTESYLNDSMALEDVLQGTSSSMSLGSYRDPLYVVIPMTVIYATIFLTGIIGNVSTCIVIARNKSMHTATNYYLFSLAVSDLLLLVSGLPAEMYLVWCKYPYIFGEGFCVLRGLASETSSNASVLTIAAFTVERYVAICHPFLSQTLSNLSRAIKLILMVWLVALLFALPQALQFGVVRHNGHPDMVMCTIKRIIISHSFELSTFLFFVIPMCLITFLYVLIGLKLRKSNMTVPGRSESAMRNCRHYPGRSSRRVVKMLGECRFFFLVRQVFFATLRTPSARDVLHPLIYVKNLERVQK